MLGMTEALGHEKLQYYGISYGTILGSVFATMFPDRVGRLAIDGVVDIVGWFNNDLASMMADTDKAIQRFFNDCHTAGPDNCAFYATRKSKRTLTRFMIPFVHNPFLGDVETFGVLSYDLLRSIILLALYTPPLFPLLAQGLAELQAGNGTILKQIDSSEPINYSGVDAQVAVECSDADPFNVDASQLRDYMSSINSTFAGAGVMTGWKVHPENHFKGPVGAANTSFPLLVIGNTADPVTPLTTAKKANLAFPGSVLLTQDSPGHTSINTVSACTQQHLAAYFANGTLPEEGTVCELDAPLFPNISSPAGTGNATEVDGETNGTDAAEGADATDATTQQRRSLSLGLKRGQM
ncbi:hypothetical protein D9758_007311 [Tetrapyrgos nigripes]|uniref:Peptidase S33 tripeptidyl aminopeptidase-like C-terminal domain-containing protein n=1 Tax=Tetrapyrgos nigripes TaxID=182062 RepID=A0A8H5GB25_9AGAR|nr:hypothetical protein D9758_007311 [Tetrapyrgos nigripes]